MNEIQIGLALGLTPELKNLLGRLPPGDLVKSKDLHDTAAKLGMAWSKYGKVIMTDTRRRERGFYYIGDLRGTGPALADVPPSPVLENIVAPVFTAPVKPSRVEVELRTSITSEISIPAEDPYFVSWGQYDIIKKVIESSRFFPVYITGVSGNGKTLMVEQACAKAKREMVRVQITPETDEDSLLGGFRLVNGETVFSYGPVINAMKRGAILLVDEVDRSSPKLMCLQGILEGKPVLIQKTGELVTPHPSFNIIATANTKGRGSVNGKYVYATMMDDAFLERFCITIEQDLPKIAVERKIIKSHMEKYGIVDDEFADKLAKWSEVIRKTFLEGGVDDIISTRRLGLIVNTYAIVRDRMMAIKLCVNRFDEEVGTAFLDVYTKIDASIDTNAATSESVKKS